VKHDAWFKKIMGSLKRNDRTVVVGHFPIFIKDIEEKESYSNFPPEKRVEMLEFLKENNVVAYLSGHKHVYLNNNYKGIQLVTGESTSKNFDKRPMGFRKWDVSADTLIHSFVPLEIVQSADTVQQTLN